MKAAGVARRHRARAARRCTPSATGRAGAVVGARSRSSSIPAVIDVSAWWGQYESIYLLFALAAVVFALNGRNGLAAAALALALMTKPQALPFLVPFAAWFWAQRRTGAGSSRTARRSALASSSSCGCRSSRPAARRTTCTTSASTRTTSSRSCRSGPGTCGGSSRSPRPAAVRRRTTTPFLGPITLRHVGYVLTGLLSTRRRSSRSLRDPRPRTLILGLAASTLIAFCFLTPMHERYAYGALIFLMLLLPERPDPLARDSRSAIVFTLNLLAAVPPTPGDRRAPADRRDRSASPARSR